METETGFNLELAIANWRSELSAEPGITDDNLRELESHLREAVAKGIESCSSNRKAFEAALRQIGSRDQIITEHAKENAGLLWKLRLFWMCWPCLVLPAWMEIEKFVSYAIADIVQNRLRGIGSGVFYIVEISQVLAVAVAIVALVRVQSGRGTIIRNVISWLVSSRVRVLTTAIAFILLGNVFLLTFVITPTGLFNYSNQYIQNALGNLSATIVFNVVLLALLTWLQPFAGPRLFTTSKDHAVDPSSQRRSGPKRSIRFGLLWLTSGCVLMQIWKLYIGEFSHAATTAIQGCLVLFLAFLWWERKETTNSGMIHGPSGDDIQSKETNPTISDGNASEGSKTHWRIAVTILAIIALTLQTAPYRGDQLNTYLPIFSLGFLLLLAVVVWGQIKFEHADSLLRNSFLAPNRVWNLRAKWMVCGGVFLHLFYMLNMGVNRTTNLATDWVFVRVAIGIIVPLASIYLLSRLSVERSFRSSNGSGARSLMMFDVLLVATLALYLGVSWFNLSQSNIVAMSFPNLLVNWVSSAIWPTAIFGVYLWMKWQNGDEAASGQLKQQ